MRAPGWCASWPELRRGSLAKPWFPASISAVLRRSRHWRQHSQFYLGHVQPTAVLGRVVDFQLFAVSPLQARRPRTGTAVGVQIVHHQDYPVRVVHIHQLSHPGPVSLGCCPSPPPAATPPRASHRLLVALVFVIVGSPDAAPRGCGSPSPVACWSRPAHQHLVVLELTDTPQHVLHGTDELALALGGMHRHSFSQGLSSFFLAHRLGADAVPSLHQPVSQRCSVQPAPSGGSAR